MIRYILDSSAVIAVFRAEAGAENVIPLLEQSAISAVNLSECITKIIASGSDDMPKEQPVSILKGLVSEVIAFDHDLALLAGEMVSVTRQFGLSLGDRACLATARIMGLEAVTADKVWAKLKLPVKIKIIR